MIITTSTKTTLVGGRFRSQFKQFKLFLCNKCQPKSVPSVKSTFPARLYTVIYSWDNLSSPCTISFLVHINRRRRKIRPITPCDHLHLKRYSTFVIPSINTISSILRAHNLRALHAKSLTITCMLYKKPCIIPGRIYILLTISQGRLEGAETAAQIPWEEGFGSW